MDFPSLLLITVGITPSIVVFLANIFVRGKGVFSTSGADWLLVFVSVNIAFIFTELFRSAGVMGTDDRQKMQVVYLLIATLFCWLLIVKAAEPAIKNANDKRLRDKKISNNFYFVLIFGTTWVGVLLLTSLNLIVHYPRITMPLFDFLQGVL